MSEEMSDVTRLAHLSEELIPDTKVVSKTRDVSKKGHHGVGNYDISISPDDDLYYFMKHQCCEKIHIIFWMEIHKYPFHKIQHSFMIKNNK